MECKFICTKKIAITVALILPFFTSFSQYGDAYHAPNTLQLSLDRQRRMTAADNAHYNNMRSSNKTSSSSPISGNYNSYGWADYSGIRKQEEAGKRQDARIKAYDDKVNKLEELIKVRRLKREPKYRTQLIRATKDAGFDDFMVTRLYGLNEKQYEEILEERKLAGIKSAYSGSTKTNCQGDCVETLTIYNGDVYTGNTLGGIPEGQGIYTSNNKEWVMTASFKAGLPIGLVKIDYKNGDRYEGGFENMNFNGQGKYSKKDGTYDEGNFEKSQLHGIGTIKGVNYTQKGNFKNGVELGVHIITFDNDENKTTIIKNYEDPSKSEIKWETSKSFFKGELDENCKMKKGVRFYESKGVTFTGYFKNENPYIGKWQKGDRILTGEFEASEKALSLKYGRSYNITTNKTTEGFFGPGMKRLGYEKDVDPSNGYISELIYTQPEVIGYQMAKFGSGTTMYLKSGVLGHQFAGVHLSEAGKETAIYYDNGGTIEIPAGSTSDLAEAIKIKGEVIMKLNEGKVAYEKVKINIEEFFKEDSKEINKKPDEPGKSLKASTKGVTVNEVNNKNDSKSNASIPNNTKNEINNESENLNKSRNNTIAESKQVKDTKTNIISKKAIITNEYRYYSNLDELSCFDWSWATPQQKQMCISTGWNGYRPKKNEEGVIVYTTKHCSNGVNLFILKIGNNYVPMCEEAIKIIN